jgi:hypothetical protein
MINYQAGDTIELLMLGVVHDGTHPPISSPSS